MLQKNVVILQHSDCEPAGRIETYLQRVGATLQYVKAHKGATIPRTTAGMNALVVLGGPMGVYEEKKYPFITGELRLLEDALNKNVPVLGICLGSQLLAKAAGGNVFPGGKKEIGWGTVRLTNEGEGDKLFDNFPKKFTPFHWHGDTFTLSKSCVHLASSDMFPMQAFRIGKNAYGLQFHIEVTAEMIQEWTALYKNDRTEKKAKSIVLGVSKNLPALNKLTVQLCRNIFNDEIASLRSQ